MGMMRGMLSIGLLCVGAWAAEAFSFDELYGTWSIESIKGNSYATFGEVKSFL
jgi:hypothetical protein